MAKRGAGQAGAGVERLRARCTWGGDGCTCVLLLLPEPLRAGANCGTMQMSESACSHFSRLVNPFVKMSAACLVVSTYYARSCGLSLNLS